MVSVREALFCLQAVGKHLPQDILWQGGFGLYVAVRHRVLEGDAPGVERDAGVGIAARCAVFEVAAYGAAHAGQLAAYLMVASGEEFHGEQEVAVALAGEAVAQAGFLAVWNWVVVGVRLVLLLVAHQPVAEFAGILRGAVGHDGEIGLVDVPLAEELVHAGQSLAGAGEYDHTAHGTVEAVGDAEEDGAGLGVLLLDVGFDALGERFVAGLVGLYDFAGGFADDDDVIVLVEYLHRNKKAPLA